MSLDFSPLDLEENRLLQAFTHSDSIGIDSFYTSPFIGKISHEQLISGFIRELVTDYFYTKIDYISARSASTLLRQMALFRKDYEGKKIQVCQTADAKSDTQALLDFLGPKTAFYSNVQSFDNPHDHPGIVMSSDSESTYKTSCLFAITEDRFLFISQYW